jgi:hypothetical protein
MAQNRAVEGLRTSGRKFVLLYEEQDPDPDPHKRDKSDPNPAALKEKEGS